MASTADYPFPLTLRFLRSLHQLRCWTHGLGQVTLSQALVVIMKGVRPSVIVEHSGILEGFIENNRGGFDNFRGGSTGCISLVEVLLFQTLLTFSRDF